MSNYCAAKVKSKEWDDVIMMGLRILEIDKNGKAMYRLAQAYNALDELESAEEYVIGALTFFPDDAGISGLKIEINQKKKELEEVE